MFRTQSSGDRQERNKGTRQFENIQWMGRCKPPGSLNSFLSYAPQLSLLPWSPWFLHFHCPPTPCPDPSTATSAIINHCKGGSICWITVLGALIHREAWRAAVHGGTKSQTRLSGWTELIHILRPESADGCDISCLLTWQEIFSFHRVNNGLFSLYIYQNINIWFSQSHFCSPNKVLL